MVQRVAYRHDGKLGFLNLLLTGQKADGAGREVHLKFTDFSRTRAFYGILFLTIQVTGTVASVSSTSSV